MMTMIGYMIVTITAYFFPRLPWFSFSSSSTPWRESISHFWIGFTLQIAETNLSRRSLHKKEKKDKKGSKTVPLNLIVQLKSITYPKM